MTFRALAVGLALALLAGCASIQRAERDPREFDILGRVLVTYSGGAFSANLRWQHAPAQDEIWLMTPTGQTLAHILDSTEGATLTRADQKTYQAASVEALTQQALGWALPLSLLQYWIRGEPAPGFPAAELVRGTAERLVALTQAGWRVAIGYQQQGEQALARRLDLTGGDNAIRFVIDTWRNQKEP